MTTPGPQESSRPSIAPSPYYAARASPQKSPLLKKYANVQDRRVNAILLEALQLIEFSKDELYTIEKSMKRLREAVHGFTMLIDKQVNIIGVDSMEERGRLKADIQDLCENLRTSNAMLEGTCSRIKKDLLVGKNQIQSHKRKLVGKAVADLVDDTEACNYEHCSVSSARSPSPSTALVVSRSPSLSSYPSMGSASPSSRPVPKKPLTKAPKIALASILTFQNPATQRNDVFQMTNEFFRSVAEAVSIHEKEFLDAKDLSRFLTELLTFSIARSGTLTFMGKAHHRRLIPRYAQELVEAIVDELQAVRSTTSDDENQDVVVPLATLCDYMCHEPFRFDQLLEEVMVDDVSGAEDASGFSPPRRLVHSASRSVPFTDSFSRNGALLTTGKPVAAITPTTEPELLETAEQTLAMAKLLHDLATAESEAKLGNKMSIRPQATRTKEFTKAYISTSKELLQKETGACP